MEEKMII